MIEQGIYFALGCIVTALCALGFLPILWNRALRLTRRRLQLQVPVSMQEILAERDQLRAQFAVERLRIDLEMDRVRATKGADMAQIGRQDVRLQGFGERVEALAHTEKVQTEQIALLSRENAEAATEAGVLRKAIHDAHELLEQRSQDLSERIAERDPARRAALSGDPEGLEREQRLRGRLEIAVAQAARHETNGLALRREADELRARARFLEDELAKACKALKHAGERDFDTAGEASNAGQSAAWAEALRSENASLREALSSLGPAIDSIQKRDHRDDKVDAELRSSIHDLGLAVALMAREARSSSSKPNRLPRTAPIPRPVHVDAD